MNTSIAVLGLPSSGKSSLIKSFEHNFGIFEPKIVVAPLSTPLSDNDDKIVSDQRSYQITVEGKEQHSLSITEYSGDLLIKRDENSEFREHMIQSLMTKSSWIIMLDGAWFQSDQAEELEKVIRKKYARIVVPMVSAYAESHNGQAPDLMFVVSKTSEYLIPFLNDEGKQKFSGIVASAFGGLVSESSKPIILFSDKNMKTALIAMLSLAFLHYRTETERVSAVLSQEIKTIEARRGQLQNKINIESEKLIKSKSVIQSLQQQVSALNQEIKDKSSMISDPLKDTMMRNLGISLHRLMLHNAVMLADGFENVTYSYDSSIEEGCFEFFWRKKAAKLNFIVGVIVFVIMAIVSLRLPGVDPETFWAGVIGTVIWGIIGLAISHPIAKILGILGFIGGFITSFANISIVYLIFFIIFAIAVHYIALNFDRIRAKRLNVPKTRFKDELVRFYDEAVQKG